MPYLVKFMVVASEMVDESTPSPFAGDERGGTSADEFSTYVEEADDYLEAIETALERWKQDVGDQRMRS